MSLLNILGGGLKSKTVKFTAPGYGIDGFEIDAVVSTDVTLSNNITTNPVEFGIAVTDNVVLSPNKIRLTGVVSEYTQRFGGLISTGGIIDEAIETAESFFSGHAPSYSGNRAQQFYTKIVELKNIASGTTFDLFIYPSTYRNLIIDSLSFEDNSKLGQSIRFNIIATEIQIATTSLTNTSNNFNPDIGAFSPRIVGGLLPNLNKAINEVLT